MKTICSLFLALSTLILAGCSSVSKDEPALSVTRTQGKGWPFGSSDTGPFLELSELAPSAKYGYTQGSPILLGGTEGGPRQSRLYLNSLRGPKGQVISYERVGS